MSFSVKFSAQNLSEYLVESDNLRTPIFAGRSSDLVTLLVDLVSYSALIIQ